MSYISLNGRSAYLAVVLLALGFIASYPSTLSARVLAGVSPPVQAAVRLEIWAIATLAAFAVFAFASRLRKLSVKAPAPWYMKLWLFPFRTLLVAALGGYIYFLYRQLPHGP